MKYLAIILLFATQIAQRVNPDSANYELQRFKINSLLEKRSSNFGQYEVSLQARTGIFGLQTKNDLRRSNEILRQIALTDNDIFRELKVLMDYKDLQAQGIAETAQTNGERLALYRASIKKLQDQNETLASQNKKLTGKLTSKNYLLGILFIALAFCAYLFIKKNGIKFSKIGS